MEPRLTKPKHSTRLKEVFMQFNRPRMSRYRHLTMCVTTVQIIKDSPKTSIKLLQKQVEFVGIVTTTQGSDILELSQKLFPRLNKHQKSSSTLSNVPQSSIATADKSDGQHPASDIESEKQPAPYVPPTDALFHYYEQEWQTSRQQVLSLRLLEEMQNQRSAMKKPPSIKPHRKRSSKQETTQKIASSKMDLTGPRFRVDLGSLQRVRSSQSRRKVPQDLSERIVEYDSDCSSNDTEARDDELAFPLLSTTIVGSLGVLASTQVISNKSLILGVVPSLALGIFMYLKKQKKTD